MASTSEPSGRNEEEGNIWNHWADMQEPLLAESTSPSRSPNKSSSNRQQEEDSGLSPPTASARVLVEEEEDPNNPRWLNEYNGVEGNGVSSNNGGSNNNNNDLESNEYTDDSSSSWEETHRRSCCLKCICFLCQPIVYVLHRPLILETSELYQNLKIQIRFLKFLILTLCGILITREVVFTLNWEHRHGLTLWETWKYDGNSILLDCIVFFSVGRLSSHKLPIDHFAWVVIVMTSSMYTSVLPQFPIFQHNFSLYELHCQWPWQLWVFVCGFLLPVILGSVVLHIRHARRKQQLTAKLLEVIGTAVLFLMPQILDDNFDFHHYYAGLLCGMHANVDVWWSRIVMAWCWGQYINGIAVWGRDPTLQCGYAQYIAQRQQCCWSSDQEGIHNDTDSCVWNTTVTTAAAESFLNNPPDWRHCPKPNTTEYSGLW